MCVFPCSNKFQLFMGHAEARLAMQRLGLLLAAVASMSGAAACQTFAGQCVGMISGGDGGQHHVSGGLVRLGSTYLGSCQQTWAGLARETLTTFWHPALLPL